MPVAGRPTVIVAMQVPEVSRGNGSRLCNDIVASFVSGFDHAKVR